MLEEQAKMKWCPFARMVPGIMGEGNQISFVEGISAYNRIVIHSDQQVLSSMCITTQCMAWIADGDKVGHCSLMKE